MSHVFLGLMIAAGLYLIIVLESVVLLTIGRSVLPEPAPALPRVGLALAALLPIYAVAGAGGGFLLGALSPARKSILGWLLSGILITFLAHATSSVAGRVTLAIAGLNFVDSDSLRSPWPLGVRDLFLIVGGGVLLGLAARRWLPVRSAPKP